MFDAQVWSKTKKNAEKGFTCLHLHVALLVGFYVYPCLLLANVSPSLKPWLHCRAPISWFATRLTMAHAKYIYDYPYT